MSNNLEFAKTIKAALDKTAPGLSGGIYMGKGDYNQDLSPRAMLIEVGSHTNDKEEAKSGVKLFAEALPAALGLAPQSASAAETPEQTGQNGQNTAPVERKPAENSGRWFSVLLILAIAGLGVGGFYWLNNPGKKD